VFVIATAASGTPAAVADFAAAFAFGAAAFVPAAAAFGFATAFVFFSAFPAATVFFAGAFRGFFSFSMLIAEFSSPGLATNVRGICFQFRRHNACANPQCLFRYRSKSTGFRSTHQQGFPLACGNPCGNADRVHRISTLPSG
jgi:hypothetical protein